MGVREIINKIRYFKVTNNLLREAFSEFLGTFILVLFGTAAIAQFVLSGNLHSSLLVVYLSWGVAVMLAVYAAGGISGGHINPAVSLAFSILGVLPWKKCPVYILSQYLGAFFASAVVYGMYTDALYHFDGGVRQTVGANATAHIWSTFPADFVSTTNLLFDQIVNTGGMMLCILAIIDERNMAVPKSLLPIPIGLLIFVIAATMSFNGGSCVNPARDLGPRIFMAMAGWGSDPFSVRDYNWFWIPVVGPHLGAIIGAGMYQMLVGRHWPTRKEEEREMNQLDSLLSVKIEE